MPTFRFRYFIVLFGLSFASHSCAAGQDRSFPADSGIVNVKDYGAKGDGVTDDSQAITNAIRVPARSYDKPLIVYFPAGTYLIGKSLEWRAADGSFTPFISFQGQNSATTILKLQDHAAGFDNPASPKAIIFTASGTSSGTPSPVGAGNEAYRNNIYDLTIDSGSGNKGAIGIDYLANNRGALQNVTIRSGDGSGVAGISMIRSYPGPCLISNVEVDGFNYGVQVTQYEYGITFEHIRLRNQLAAGISNQNNILSIRDLTTSGAVPAVLNLTANGMVVIIDSVLTGLSGASSYAAIQNSGDLFARNVTTTGYAAAIKDMGSLRTGALVDEYTSGAAMSLFSSPLRSLRLPIHDTPVTVYDSTDRWASVVSYGATPNNQKYDSRPAIQAAIDSGASTIYFPQGAYYIGGTVYLRGNVKTVAGMDSYIYPLAKSFNDPNFPAALVSFSGGAQQTTVVENLAIRGTGGGLIAVEHDSTQTLVLKHCLLYGVLADYWNTSNGTGDFYAEDVQIDILQIRYPQNVWARQLDAESLTYDTAPGFVRAHNSGGVLWVLGVKTEGGGTVISTDRGGSSELLGGLLYPATTVRATDPAFINTDSNVSLTYATSSSGAANNYTIHVQETRNRMMRVLTRRDLPMSGIFAPLYVGVTPAYWQQGQRSATPGPGGRRP